MVTNDVLQIVKARLGLSDGSLDVLILSYISEIEQRIKHYCNIGKVPKELNFVWASIVIEVLKAKHSTIDVIADIIDSPQSIKIGDTSITPAKASNSNSDSDVINNIILNYKADLIHYRRFRW